MSSLFQIKTILTHAATHYVNACIVPLRSAISQWRIAGFLICGSLFKQSSQVWVAFSHTFSSTFLSLFISQLQHRCDRRPLHVDHRQQSLIFSFSMHFPLLPVRSPRKSVAVNPFAPSTFDIYCLLFFVMRLHFSTSLSPSSSYSYSCSFFKSHRHRLFGLFGLNLQRKFDGHAFEKRRERLNNLKE